MAASRLGGAVRRRGEEGHGRPGLTQDERRLERLEHRSLKEGPVVRLILDGAVARVRLDRQAASISLPVALGVRADGQKALPAIKDMGGKAKPK